MPVVTKSAAQATAKWQARTGVAAQDYASGVANTQKDQAALAAAAAPAWAAGTAAAAQSGTYARRVQAAGTGAWKMGVANKGAARYAPGTAAAGPKFSNAIGPVISTIQGLDLGPRYPRGDPRNQARSTAVQVALHKLRVGG